LERDRLRDSRSGCAGNKGSNAMILASQETKS
jgi:hypothetical protein